MATLRRPGWWPRRVLAVRTFTSPSRTTATIEVERRLIRLGRAHPFEVGLVRPTRVTALIDGRRYALDIPRVDPWLRAVLGTLVLWFASAAVLAAARQWRGRHEHGRRS
jgi:hypothetical protein